MKKTIVLILLVLLFPLNVKGALTCFGALNSNDDTTLEAGDEITINMGVSSYSNIQYISDASFSFTFNPSVFELVKEENGNYLTVNNRWETYVNKIDTISTELSKVNIVIGTSNEKNYFHDTSGSLIFAKAKLKVKSNAVGNRTTVTIFDNESSYTTFELGKDGKTFEKIYDVSCSSKNIGITLTNSDSHGGDGVMSSNADLKSLNVTNLVLNPKFDPSVTRYNLVATNDIEKVYIAGTCAGVKCVVRGNGTRTLKVGTNTYELVVTAEDGTTKTYTVSITKEEKEKQMAYLKSLTIEGHHTEPSFRSTTLVYDLPISSKTNTLKIYGICEAEYCDIEGDGLIKIKDTTETVSVIVSTDDDTKTYTFNILREDSLNEYEPEEQGSGGGFIVFLWILFVGLLVVGAVYFYRKSGINIKISKEDKNDKNKNIDNSWRYK